MPVPGITRGHALLRQWLVERAETANRRDASRPDAPPRPPHAALESLRNAINEIAAEDGVPDQQTSSSFSLYAWIEGTDNPAKPSPWRRTAIERHTGGAVPASSWLKLLTDDEPAAETS